MSENFIFSWHLKHGFCWYQNENLPTDVDDNVVNLWDNTWFCFLVRKANQTLIARNCASNNFKHHYTCEESKFKQVIVI